MSFFNKLKEAFFWIWQLPQNLVGLIMLLYYRNAYCYHKENGRKYYYTQKMVSGISLGNYIILKYEDWDEDMHHEYGHSRQSRILGPLYLLLIGLPSLIGNIYDSTFHTKKRGWAWQDSYKWYYNQPWEKWADKLGGVVRNV